MTNKPIINSEDLLNAVCKADQVIQQVYAMKDKETNLRNQVATQLIEAEETKKDHKKVHIILPLVLAIPTLMGLLFIYALVTSFFDIDFDFLEKTIQWVLKFTENLGFGVFIGRIVIFLAPIVLILFLLTKFIPCNDKQKIEAAKKAEVEAIDVHNELEAFIENNKQYVAIIAPEFRYPIASRELVRIFQLGRATTLPEAYDKLELKLHQMKVEEGLGTMIALQIAQIGKLEEIKYNTEWL